MAAKLVRSSTLVLLLTVAFWTSSCVLLPAAMADHTVQPATAAGAQPTSLPATGPTTTGTLPEPAATSSSPASAATAAAAELPPATPAAAGAAASEPATTTAAAAADATTAPKKFPLPTTTPGGGVGGEPVLPTPHGGPGEPDIPVPLPHGGGPGEPYLPAAEVASALPVPTPDELPSGASLGFGSNGGLGYGGPGDECCGGPGGYGWFGGPGGFGPGTYGYSGPLYWGAAPAMVGTFGRVTNIVLPLIVAFVSAAIFA